MQYPDLKRITFYSPAFTTLGNPLGTGGCGKVYKAKIEGLGEQIVAVKIITAALEDEKELWPALLREANFMLKHHQGILQLLALYIYPNTDPTSFFHFNYALVMELMDCSLADMIQSAQPLDLMCILSIIQTIADVLRYLHQNGFIYRDLKPENVLVRKLETDEYAVKLGDFGFSRSIPHSVDENMTIGRGTKPYMAPEVCYGSSNYGQSADVYSFGILILYILIGQYPFEQKVFGLLTADAYEGRRCKIPNLLSGHITNTDLRNKYCNLITKCLNFEANKRPGMNLIVEELEEIRRFQDGILRMQERYERSRKGPELGDEGYVDRLMEMFQEDEGGGLPSPGP